MGKKGGKGKKGGDDDEFPETNTKFDLLSLDGAGEEESIPQPAKSKKAAKGKQQQNGKKGAQKHEEEDDMIEDEDEPVEEVKPAAAKGGKGKQQQNEKKGQAAPLELEDEEDWGKKGKGGKKGKQTSPAPAPAPAQGGKGGKKGKKQPVKEEEEEEEEEPEEEEQEEEEEEEEAPAPAKGKGGKGGKGQPAPAPTQKGGKGGKAAQAIPPPQKGKQPQQQQGKKGKKQQPPEEEEEEEEEQEEQEEQEEEEEEEEPEEQEEEEEEEEEEEAAKEKSPSPEEEDQEDQEDQDQEEGESADPAQKRDRKAERKERKERDKLRKIEKLKAEQDEDKEKKPEVDILADEEDEAGGPLLGDNVYVHKFTIFMGGKTLFKDATLTLSFGHRYGLVGYNGTGKTTLMKVIASREGDFKIAKHLDLLLVEQEAPADDTTALQKVIEADELRTKLLEEEKAILARDELAKEADKGAESERLRKVYEKLEEIGSSSAEARASMILSGLQFTEEMKKKKTREFSGGWRMRIALARALFRRPKILLLDEPTNHLDLHAVIWLQNYLMAWPNTLVVVSHDRDFLSNVCTDMLHVWQQKVVHYKGNYDVFEKNFKQLIVQHNEAFEKQQKKLKVMKSSGKVTTDVTKSSARETGQKKKQRQALIDSAKGKGSKPKGLEDEDEASDELLSIIRDYVVKLHFTAAGELPMPLLKVEDVTFGYPGKESLFEHVDFGINMDSRIAIVGKNGTGKSTLLKLCTKELEPSKGYIYYNPKLRIGVYSQHSVDQLELDKTPVEYLRSKFPDLKYEQARKYLGTIGLPGHIHEHPIRTLSGGQKARVVFVELQLTKCHILLFDEPTNHLDLETIDALIGALKEFEGGVVVITHNVNLIQELCEEIWECGDDKSVNVFEGDFEDYIDKLVEEMTEMELLQSKPPTKSY